MQPQLWTSSMLGCGFNFDNSYLTLPQRFFSKLKPTAVANPTMVILNHELAQSMELDFSILNRNQQAELFAGNCLPEGSEPFAQAYAGHQFGHFTLLGDGRALVWGEHLTPNNARFDIQFKGSGPTPYSRRGDGRAALGPMLREYLVAEAMHHLGIPTTRSLAVVTTGEPVRRETIHPGAILTRVASSHIRVGTVDLVIDWMRVGFVHGVMNTDNMSVTAKTMDYGPCAFMDGYDPNTVFSSIDNMGRYAYSNQPKVVEWNLARFAETLLPLIDQDIKQAVAIAEDCMNRFSLIYHGKWLAMMRAKLGLAGDFETDTALITDLLNWLQQTHADYTNTFRDLSQIDKPAGEPYQDKAFAEWYQRWQARLKQNSIPFASALDLMKQTNPAIIPRNHKVEQALTAAENGNYELFYNAVEAFKTPYSDDSNLQHYRTPAKPSERIYQTFCGT